MEIALLAVGLLVLLHSFGSGSPPSGKSGVTSGAAPVPAPVSGSNKLLAVDLPDAKGDISLGCNALDDCPTKDNENPAAGAMAAIKKMKPITAPCPCPPAVKPVTSQSDDCDGPDSDDDDDLYNDGAGFGAGGDSADEPQYWEDGFGDAGASFAIHKTERWGAPPKVSQAETPPGDPLERIRKRVAAQEAHIRASTGLYDAILGGYDRNRPKPDESLEKPVIASGAMPAFA